MRLLRKPTYHESVHRFILRFYRSKWLIIYYLTPELINSRRRLQGLHAAEILHTARRCLGRTQSNYRGAVYRRTKNFLSPRSVYVIPLLSYLIDRRILRASLESH